MTLTFSFWFDNVFESKYHRKTFVLLLTAHILSLQDVVLRSMFFLIYAPRVRSFQCSVMFTIPVRCLVLNIAEQKANDCIFNTTGL